MLYNKSEAISGRLITTYRHLAAIFGFKSKITADSFLVVPDGEVVTDSRGWKVASLLDPLGPVFEGVSYGKYTLNSSAECNLKRHLAPDLHCRCGFHSFLALAPAIRIWAQRIGTVLLRVELYGKIIEHGKGSRAEEQEVSAIFLPRLCEVSFCHGSSVGIALRQRLWLTVCSKHLPLDYNIGYDASRLRNLWKIDVVLGNPT